MLRMLSHVSTSLFLNTSDLGYLKSIYTKVPQWIERPQLVKMAQAVLIIMNSWLEINHFVLILFERLHSYGCVKIG